MDSATRGDRPDCHLLTSALAKPSNYPAVRFSLETLTSGDARTIDWVQTRTVYPTISYKRSYSGPSSSSSSRKESAQPGVIMRGLFLGHWLLLQACRCCPSISASQQGTVTTQNLWDDLTDNLINDLQIFPEILMIRFDDEIDDSPPIPSEPACPR